MGRIEDNNLLGMILWEHINLSDAIDAPQMHPTDIIFLVIMTSVKYKQRVTVCPGIHLIVR